MIMQSIVSNPVQNRARGQAFPRRFDSALLWSVVPEEERTMIWPPMLSEAAYHAM